MTLKLVFTASLLDAQHWSSCGKKAEKWVWIGDLRKKSEVYLWALNEEEAKKFVGVRSAYQSNTSSTKI